MAIETRTGVYKNMPRGIVALVFRCELRAGYLEDLRLLRLNSTRTEQAKRARRSRQLSMR